MQRQDCRKTSDAPYYVGIFLGEEPATLASSTRSYPVKASRRYGVFRYLPGATLPADPTSPVPVLDHFYPSVTGPTPLPGQRAEVGNSCKRATAARRLDYRRARK